jgi:OOP family OmpA-OmpF porin
MAFSWKGLRWRLESLKTGKPFSEVVMLNTLVYRVEQLFLIHRQTGLVLSHLVGEDVASQDADMVSAMLTAIQDFVRDCFAGGQEGDLDAMQMGDYTLLVEQSPYA